MNLQTLVSLVLAGTLSAAQPGPGGYGGGGPGGPGAWGGNYADFPSCAQSCSPQWDGNTCATNTWSGCLCGNDALISTANSCIAASSCSEEDKNSVYQKIAALCASTGTTITNAPQADFTGTALSWTGTGPWGPGGTGWSGYSNGNGPWTKGSWSNGPWSNGPWSNGPFNGGSWTSGPWRTGAWTSWWNGADCPDENWPGWTAGPWSSSPAWTSWAKCSATTTQTSVTVTNTAGEVAATATVETKVAAVSADAESRTLVVATVKPTETAAETNGGGRAAGPCLGGLMVALVGAVLAL